MTCGCQGSNAARNSLGPSKKPAKGFLPLYVLQAFSATYAILLQQKLSALHFMLSDIR